LNEEQAKIEAIRLLLSGDAIQEALSRYLRENDLTAPTFNIQENFYRQQLISVRVKCVVERNKDPKDNYAWAKSARFAAAYGGTTLSWQKPNLPTLQNVMVRLRKYCRNTFDAVPKLALRSGKIVVDMRVLVPEPVGAD
jgi:hypothetical protein